MPKCYHCGQSHYFMAKVTRGDETRYFCHINERSCYNELRGRYFDE